MNEPGDWIPDEVDFEKPSAARMYDYVLGGSHNFAVDRDFVDRLMIAHPDVRQPALANRAFLRRAVQFMSRSGIRQFLDLGSGIPTVGNVHEIAQKAVPESRVVYVDYEDVAVAHSRLLLRDNDRATMVRADATDTARVLRAAACHLDFTQPVGLLAVTLLHYIAPEREPNAVVAAYRAALAAGSQLAITHLTADFAEVETGAIVKAMRDSRDHLHPRPYAEVLRLFAGFELVEPGLVTTSQWRPDSSIEAAVDPRRDGLYAGVGIKRGFPS